MELGFIFYLLLAVIAVTAVAIVITVLMQPTKSSGGLGGLSGATSTDSVLGTSRNEVLAKFTWVLLIIFLGSSVILGSLTAKEIREQDKAKNTESQSEQLFKEDVKAPEAPAKTEEAPTAPAAE